MKNLVFLNSAIFTRDGAFDCTTISLEEAKSLAIGSQSGQYNLISAIGHESTATILTKLLGVEIPVNRIAYKQEPTDLVVAFKLSQRMEQPKDLITEEEIEKIGYEFKLIRDLVKYQSLFNIY